MKIKELKTSELLDRLDIESSKEEADDKLIGAIEEELDSRLPFCYIEHRLEGDEGIVKRLEQLENQVEKLQKQIKDHDHKDGKVVVRI